MFNLYHYHKDIVDVCIFLSVLHLQLQSSVTSACRPEFQVRLLSPLCYMEVLGVSLTTAGRGTEMDCLVSLSSWSDLFGTATRRDATVTSGLEWILHLVLLPIRHSLALVSFVHTHTHTCGWFRRGGFVWGDHDGVSFWNLNQTCQTHPQAHVVLQDSLPLSLSTGLHLSAKGESLKTPDPWLLWFTVRVRSTLTFSLWVGKSDDECPPLYLDD